MENYNRPSWDEYFMSIAHAVSTRSTCDRGRVGCVIVKDKRIMTTGYAGAPKGLPHCDEAGHLFRKTLDENGNVVENCVRTTHAEQNAIAQAALHGIAINGATLYGKMTPCLNCAKMIINSGIKRVVVEKDYHDGALPKQMLKDAGVELVVLNSEVLKY